MFRWCTNLFWAWQAGRAERLNKLRRAAAKRDWRAHPYGGGAPITLGNMAKQDALDHCATHYGNVMFTDETQGFIFYKPFGWKPPGI